MKDALILEKMNQLARDLPEGYEVRICVERHSGWVDLYGPDGGRIEFPSNMETMVEQIDDAFQHAIDLASGAPENG
jgi:hypothetical protein